VDSISHSLVGIKASAATMVRRGCKPVQGVWASSRQSPHAPVTDASQCLHLRARLPARSIHSAFPLHSSSAIYLDWPCILLCSSPQDDKENAGDGDAVVTVSSATAVQQPLKVSQPSATTPAASGLPLSAVKGRVTCGLCQVDEKTTLDKGRCHVICGS
jgi:hypothetical protein